MSPVTLVIKKLLETPAVQTAIDVYSRGHAVAPVRLPDDFPGRGITVSRVYDEREDNVSAVVLVSCFAAAYADVEAIGDAAVAALRDGDEPWSHGGADDVQFEKMGPDVDGWDAARGQYVRSIEFSVRW